MKITWNQINCFSSNFQIEFQLIFCKRIPNLNPIHTKFVNKPNTIILLSCRLISNIKLNNKPNFFILKKNMHSNLQSFQLSIHTIEKTLYMRIERFLWGIFAKLTWKLANYNSFFIGAMIKYYFFTHFTKRFSYEPFLSSLNCELYANRYDKKKTKKRFFI